MKIHYDAVIVGSGLGGLVSAIILAKEGYSVCVLEKNKQYGGNLQIFARNKTIFDTGVHYIGGLSKGQNLYQFFKYIDIIDDLNIKKLDENGFDIITFDNDVNEYRHAQGYENFIKVLVEQFPEEEPAIITYCDKLRETCDRFPLYNLKLGSPYFNDTSIFQLQAKRYINSLTKNKKLQAVLSGTNLLYAGDGERTPFYVHALTINSYIESAYRCVNGGSQITKALIKNLKKHNGEIYKRHDVVKFGFDDGKITSTICSNGKEIRGNLFISNFEPKLTLKLVGEDKFKKAYVNRVNKIESTIAAFSLYIVLKPNSFKYQNKNFYHFKNYDKIWSAHDYTQESWPEGYMMSFSTKKNMGKYVENMTVMTYMNYDEVNPWVDTFNTVANKNERGQTYDQFKEAKAEILLKEVERKFPNLRDCIHEIYTSTPLTYRDYIGSNRGSMYGYVKDVNRPLQSFISPKTKIKNLLFTGQSLNMHGVLGVTISAVITCSEILGKEYLLNKILKANNQQEISQK